VDESFGPLIAEWDDGSTQKQKRLAGLVERLGLEKNAVAPLRYQLLHRTIATLPDAEREGASEAAMVVQSFSPSSIRAGFTDFQSFAAALGIPIDQPGELSCPIERVGVRLQLGWAEDRIRALTNQIPGLKP
jgi:hypothetical protein